ncbi:RNA-directed DNA polymerase [Elizabethkingia anophelis]|nr:RNA-directed DNA polymerase [Elizabethkingia anophelis]MCT4277079.1 RNA-directed DNA polymerase [Elizabethkingia anophelis]MCT4280492.1 RNA-directed DNA polymerase [Elizabethkingia anophelis]
MRKKIKISYSKERVVLSDILPFEIPLIFSNRYFYKYLLKCENFNKKIDKKKEELKKTTNGALKRKLETDIDHLNFHISILQTFAGNSYINKPMCFKIKHKESDYRELSLIHPINQKNVVEFYDKYKSLIIYYSSISPFSIRKPTKIANFTFYNDLLHKKNEDDCYEYSQIEEEDNEYENLRSFFAYHKYSNIHKFYESYQFHRSEKKFNNLLKIDVSKCFDSIYSHTIAWALFNKQIIKDNVDISLETFGGKFDKLMQTLNANETNGIVIGPEFSRIFAELILQQIDKCIFDNLLHNTENNKRLIHKRDYEIFRYVDDYFVFYNSESDKDIILKEFKICLKEYKLYLNEKKSITYDKPIITEISLAKQKISDLFSEHLKLNENKNDDILKSIYFSSNNVITRFKTIVKETKIDYKDIMNYSLAVLENKTAKLIKKWHTFENKNDNLQKQYEKGFLEILDVSFFLYSVSPRVNSTIKLSLILNKIIAFLKKNKSNFYKEPLLNHYKHNVFKKISDEVYLILQKNKTEIYTPIESLYLLIALTQLGREYRLSPKNLSAYFNIQVVNDKFIIDRDLNYFNTVVLLFYIKDIEIYKPIKEELKKYILKKFKEKKDFEWRNEAETVMLLMDILTCPFLNDSISKEENIKISELINNIKTEFIKPVSNSNLDSYIDSLKTLLRELYNLNPIKERLIDMINFNKLSSNLKAYLEELKNQPNFFSQIYKREQDISNALDSFTSKFKVENKYKFKKDVLNLLEIKSYQKRLIESEKYWFIKWNDFDFGMELQAKKSQEVY